MKKIITVGDVVKARRAKDDYEAAISAKAYKAQQESDQEIKAALAADPSLGLLIRNGKPTIYRIVDGKEQIVSI